MNKLLFLGEKKNVYYRHFSKMFDTIKEIAIVYIDHELFT